MSNMRQRGEETPSHPGGLSEIARQRLDDYKKKRDSQQRTYFDGMFAID